MPDALRTEIEEADVSTVVETAVAVADEMMDGSGYPSSVTYGSELPLDSLPVILTAETRAGHQVVCRLTLPEGEVFGRVTVYFAGSRAGR